MGFPLTTRHRGPRRNGSLQEADRRILLDHRVEAVLKQARSRGGQWCFFCLRVVNGLDKDLIVGN